MDRIALGLTLVAVPIVVLVYLGYRIVGAVLRLYRSGLVAESLGLLGATTIFVGLAGMFANERALLIVGLLSWMYLAAVLIRLVLSQDEPTPARTTRTAIVSEEQDPNSLNFSGVGPGSQGFGVYAGGVRIAHDHFEND